MIDLRTILVHALEAALNSDSDDPTEFAATIEEWLVGYYGRETFERRVMS